MNKPNPSIDQVTFKSVEIKIFFILNNFFVVKKTFESLF